MGEAWHGLSWWHDNSFQEPEENSTRDRDLQPTMVLKYVKRSLCHSQIFHDDGRPQARPHVPPADQPGGRREGAALADAVRRAALNRLAYLSQRFLLAVQARFVGFS